MSPFIKHNVDSFGPFMFRPTKFYCRLQIRPQKDLNQPCSQKKNFR